MENEKIKHLLNQVGSLLKSYDKIAKVTGENFNIFSVMGVERDEVKTHSRIIAELLNPKGSHSQGSVFLKYFFEEIDELKSIENFNFEKATVKVEEHIGEINEDYTVGGYIDIVIDDGNNNIIVIENKIDAPDQKGQLLRYKNHYNDCKLIYLTKNGKKPSEASYYFNTEININLEEIILVCYKDKILSWIQKCHKEAIQQPMLREMLKQYSNLLKKLTHQTINNELKMEISDLIKNNFLEALEIKNNYDQAKNEVISEFWKELGNSVQSDLKKLDKNWTVKVDDAKLISRFNHILLFNEANEDAYLYCRYNKNDGEITYGIILNQKFIKIKGTDVLKEVAPNSKFKSGLQSVIWEKEKDENYNFGESEFLTSLYKNHKKQDVTIVTIFKKKIIEFIEFNQTLYLATLKYLEEPNLIINSNLLEKENAENQSECLSNK